MKLPKHLAIILDGNRRWADKSNISRKDVIWNGIAKVKEILFIWTERFEKAFKQKPFEQLTIYALTYDNILKRPKEELNEIYKAFTAEAIYMLNEVLEIHKKQVKVKFGGSLHFLPEGLGKALRLLEEATEEYDNYKFFVPIAYSGNMEILDACDKVAHKHIAYSQNDLIKTFTESLYFPEALPIDMLIRTGGEMRLSGFMLWYVSQAELFFTETFPEDFTYEEFVEMIEAYGKRDRRFGQ